MTTRDEVVARLTAPGNRFEIRSEEVLGQPLPVFANRHRSLRELLDASLEHASPEHREAEYLVAGDTRIGFTEHHARVAALATALREEHGIGKGDRVALCGANSAEWIIAFWATTALGAIAVGMNSMWVGPEIQYGLDLTEPALLFADAQRRELAGEQQIPVLSFADDLPALVDEYAGSPMPEVEIDEDDPAVILFTSGTTGRPKGATHSHRNMVSAVWFHLLNDAVAAELGSPPQQRRFLLVTPLFHIAALHNLAVIRLAVGDTAVLHLGRFDIDEVLRLVERERVTNWGAVPTMLSRLLEADLSAYDLRALQTVSVSSAPSSPELKERLRQALPQVAARLGTTYGLTESSTAATLATPAELAADAGTVGRAIPTMEVEVRDARGGRVPDGVEGEIHLRGAPVMLGYWRNPQATADSTAADGWFRTGDLGTLREGHLYVSSRRSDLILRGGENIYPAEVEDRLTAHPQVRECIVMGVPDEEMGQAVAALVVTLPGGGVSEDELRRHASEHLARYKVPTRWVLSTRELPRNATGKVDRQRVRVD